MAIFDWKLNEQMVPGLVDVLNIELPCCPDA
jgi:hypothetical protein